VEASTMSVSSRGEKQVHDSQTRVPGYRAAGSLASRGCRE
jgi:hypothetical protein